MLNMEGSYAPNGLLESIIRRACPGNYQMRASLVLWTTTLVLVVIISLSKLVLRRSKKVYLLDFACRKPNESQSVTNEAFLEVIMRANCRLTEESMHFCKRVLYNAGVGESTYVAYSHLTVPSEAGLAASRKETEATVFAAVEEVLRKAGVAAHQVGIVVANCSIFCPDPSLSDMVVNKFGMREDVTAFNLSGMGCSAGVAAIALAHQLLQVHENAYALVVSMESIAENAYKGKNRDMLVVNCVFRVGGAAILLSNRPSAASAAKYQFLHAVRTHHGGVDPTSYTSVFQEEDCEGHLGLSISKDLLVSANRAIRTNLTGLGMVVLPLKVKLRYLLTHLARRYLGCSGLLKPYTPDLKLGFDHFFPHVGGRPVLDEMARALKLDEVDMEPSRMTFYRFGNTSSSSLWYEMAYAEAKGRVKKGDRLLQLGFGSGFKCNSVVWRALRSIQPREVDNPWTKEIDHFPLVPDTNRDKDGDVFTFHSAE